MQTEPTRTEHRERLMRLPQVEEATGLKKSSIYAMQSKGEFPKAVKVSARAVCWSASAIDQWIADRIKAGGQ